MACSSFRLRIIVSIILLCGMLTPAFSQDSASVYHNEILKNRIYLAPLHFFDAITPSIQVGYERSLNRDYGLQLEAGLVTKRSFWGYLMVDILGNPPDYYSTFSGYKIRGELKRYLHIDRVPTNQAYISAELTFLSSCSSVYDFFVVSDPDSLGLEEPSGDYVYTYEDFFEIEKIRIGLNIKYGAIINLTPHLNIEFYTGIGLAFRNSVHYDRDYPEDELYDPVLSHSHLEGHTWMPTFPIGMKFGYKF